MDSENATQSQKPLDLTPVVGQIVDKMKVDEMLCYGPISWETFKASRPLDIECFTESVIGCERPQPSQLVVSLDYLHTVSMLRIKDVLDELKRLVEYIGFFHISYEAHHSVSWWLKEFDSRFDLQTFQRVPGGFYVIVYPKSH